MAKFKRYDPRNKKSVEHASSFGAKRNQQQQKRSKMIAQQQTNELKRIRNEQNLYSLEEEFDL